MMEKRKYQLYFRFTYVLVALFGVTLALEIGSSTIFNQSFFCILYEFIEFDWISLWGLLIV